MHKNVSVMREKIYENGHNKDEQKLKHMFRKKTIEPTRE